MQVQGSGEEGEGRGGGKREGERRGSLEDLLTTRISE